MARVRQRGTTPELEVRFAVRMLGVAYRLNAEGLPGSPDLANRTRRFAIFVHGCFWHRHRGCRRTTNPTHNADFWRAKFAANQARDRRNRAALAAAGYAVHVVWECETRDARRLRTNLAAFFTAAKRNQRAHQSVRVIAEQRRPIPNTPSD